MGAARKGLVHTEHNRTTTIATRSGMERFGADYCLTRAAPATFANPDAEEFCMCRNGGREGAGLADYRARWRLSNVKKGGYTAERASHLREAETIFFISCCQPCGSARYRSGSKPISLLGAPVDPEHPRAKATPTNTISGIGGVVQQTAPSFLLGC